MTTPARIMRVLGRKARVMRVLNVAGRVARLVRGGQLPPSRILTEDSRYILTESGDRVAI